MKFKVGQIWEDKSGNRFKIIKTEPLDDEDNYPIKAENLSTGYEYIYTEEGYYCEFPESDSDLKNLISDVPSESKKTLNFWEARQAALSGKKVRRVGETIVYAKTSFTDEFGWDNNEINAEWEIVEEPIQVVTVHQVFSDGTVGAGAYPRLDTDPNNKVRIAMLEIITDQDGKLISAKNI